MRISGVYGAAAFSGLVHDIIDFGVSPVADGAGVTCSIGNFGDSLGVVGGRASFFRGVGLLFHNCNSVYVPSSRGWGYPTKCTGLAKDRQSLLIREWLVVSGLPGGETGVGRVFLSCHFFFGYFSMVLCSSLNGRFRTFRGGRTLYCSYGYRT